MELLLDTRESSLAGSFVEDKIKKSSRVYICMVCIKAIHFTMKTSGMYVSGCMILGKL